MSSASLPRIGIFWDQRYTRAERYTGVGKHILRVVGGLLRREDLDGVLLAAADQGEALGDLAERMRWEVSIRVLPDTMRRLKWGWGLRGPGSVMKDLDLVYSPQELYLKSAVVPILCTLHGFPYFLETLPPAKQRSWGYRLERTHQRRLMRRLRQAEATALTVSDYLSEEAVSRFELDPGKLVMVGNGVEDVFFDAPLCPRPDGDAGVVQVGGLNAFDGAGEVCALLPMLEREGIPLDVLGDWHESPYIDRASGFEGLRLHGFVSGSALRAHLSASRALLCVPGAESFGITGLEALALGVPVIARKVGGVYACLGSAALWLEREDVEEVMEKLEELAGMSDAEYRSLQERGRDRAKQFRWDAVVERVALVLREYAGREAS